MVYVPKRLHKDNKVGLCKLGGDGDNDSSGLGGSSGSDPDSDSNDSLGGIGGGAADNAAFNGVDGNYNNDREFGNGSYGAQQQQQDGYGNGPNEYGYAPSLPPPPPPTKPIFKALTMGGSMPTTQTQAPTYDDLKAKHTAGYQDPVSKNRNTPQLFNFNGTVYQYEPETDGYRDTYTGMLINPGSDLRGSLGIAGLYANETVTPPPPPLASPDPINDVTRIDPYRETAGVIGSIRDTLIDKITNINANNPPPANTVDSGIGSLAPPKPPPKPTWEGIWNDKRGEWVLKNEPWKTTMSPSEYKKRLAEWNYWWG